jgi:hypothetical protein
MITAENGGVISNGRVTLVFPPNALDEDTEITIEMDTDGTLGVELKPHGIQFSHPVIMTMDLVSTTAEGRGGTSAILWFNDMQEWWEVIDKVQSHNNEIKTKLNHFSKYKGDMG